MSIWAYVRSSCARERDFLAISAPAAGIFVAYLVTFGEPALAAVYVRMPQAGVAAALALVQLALVVSLAAAVPRMARLVRRDWAPGMRNVCAMHAAMLAFLCAATCAMLPGTAAETASFLGR